MNIDLHCHSHFSDGKHSLQFLIARAISNNITHLAITDHDCIDAFAGYDSNQADIELISGVEISCHWQELEIHIIGLQFRLDHTDLISLLRAQQTKRRERLLSIDTRLSSLGTTGLSSYLQSLPCVSVTRSHMADFLVQTGLCKDHQKAFKKYLGKGGRIYHPADWCSLEKAISTINLAGGIAVLAHPGRYPLSKRKLETLLSDFKDVGGEALEVSYSNIDPSSKLLLSKLAREKQLYCSVGSDFHDADAHWTDIGKFPALDSEAKKNAIWLHPKWHSTN